MQATLVRSLCQEDPLENEMATHSVFLPGKSHGQRSPTDYSSLGHKESDRTESTLAELVNNVMIVSGGHWRDPVTHMHVSILLQTSLPSRLPQKIEQNS